MSSFDSAIIDVLKHEGFYVNDPDDTGGETNFGISLFFLVKTQDLDQDQILDGDANRDGKLDAEDIRRLDKPQAIKLYRLYWWDKYQYYLIKNQSVASKLLDISVNMGHKAAIKCLQKAVRAASGIILLNDGVLGMRTLNAVNNCDSLPLIAAFKAECANYYRTLNRQKYLDGWLNRAYA